jgi:hypothetical protein
MVSDRHQEAISILDTLILATMVGPRSLDIFSALDNKLPLSANMRADLTRMSTTHLVLALAKWMKFYVRYRSLLPQKTTVAAKTLYNDLKERGVRDFRNKVAGHIWDKEIGRPLSAEDGRERLVKVIGPDEHAFDYWIYDPGATERTNHLIGLTEEIPDPLRTGKPTSN